MKMPVFFAVLFVASVLYANSDYGPFMPFQDGQAKYGYKGKGGLIVIEPKFDYADKFHDGMAVVGNVIVEEDGDGRYESVPRFGYIHEDSIRKDVYGKVGWNGKFAIPMDLERAERFKGGIAEVCGEICGVLGCCVINKNGDYFRDKESYLLDKQYRNR